jgi:hypothetical protein
MARVHLAQGMLRGILWTASRGPLPRLVVVVVLQQQGPSRNSSETTDAQLKT